MDELERTFLVKFIPNGLKNCSSKEIIDIYIPKSSPHPIIRIRKIGNMLEMTKKQPVKSRDRSHQIESTISLSKAEYRSLARLNGKQLRKIRYYYKCNNRVAEIDIFQGPLKGLVLVDFEFKSKKEKNAFKPPAFCLADVTQELFAAGGWLAGKKYADIAQELKKFGYRKLILK